MAAKKKTSSKLLKENFDSAVINTLQYRAVFNNGLSYFQLATFLIENALIDSKAYDSCLKRLVKAKKIYSENNIYHRVSSKEINWKSRYDTAKKILEDNKHVFDLLAKIKWIRMVGVTGSIAAYSANKDDDIDLFIVTEKGRLWLTRFFVVLYLKSLGVYINQHNKGNKFCPNIYIDETSLTWNTASQNIYTAHEVLMLQPVVNKGDTYFKYLHANSWVFKYFTNYPVEFPINFERSKKFKSILVDWLEVVCMTIQKRYMKNKQTKEITSRTLIHFNLHDHTQMVLTKYAGFN